MTDEERKVSLLTALGRVSFEEDLYRLMSQQNLSRSDLAQKVGASTAYISKIFNGTTNYTLKTMAKLAQAVGATVQVRLALEGQEVVRVMDVESARAYDTWCETPESERISSAGIGVFRMFRGDEGKVLLHPTARVITGALGPEDTTESHG